MLEPTIHKMIVASGTKKKIARASEVRQLPTKMQVFPRL
ncbi:hypothetical protein SORDD05_01816 [Streptococcus oralis]|uniref:Uncharacterized protein n=1 Tax=Streptococcus oralis TaxID=1303 RepID=A0A139M5T0_STROR|nr:hypothetical protein SORDD05_01816 [Streptococcus oralis]